MKFKVDENLPIEVADLFEAAGHEASTVHEEGLGGAEDQRIVEQCRVEGRVLITLDVGFADIREYGRENIWASSCFGWRGRISDISWT